MKGTFFQKPLELSLRVEGESWRQAETVSGVLEIRNHGAEAVAARDLRVLLARGELKKVRSKAPEAFLVLAKASAPEGFAVGPGQSGSFQWSFPTDRNFGITDSGGSPFLLYGPGEAAEKLGQLQLPFRPHWVIEELVKVFVTVFRFVPKGEKWSKAGAVELKLAPPDSKAFTTLELLVLSARFEGEALSLAYQFQVKQIEPTAGSFEVKKGKKESRQQLAPAEYLLPSGRIHPERLEAAIREALAQMEQKILF